MEKRNYLDLLEIRLENDSLIWSWVVYESLTSNLDRCWKRIWEILIMLNHILNIVETETSSLFSTSVSKGIQIVLVREVDSNTVLVWENCALVILEEYLKEVVMISDNEIRCINGILGLFLLSLFLLQLSFLLFSFFAINYFVFFQAISYSEGE